MGRPGVGAAAAAPHQGEPVLVYSGGTGCTAGQQPGLGIPTAQLTTSSRGPDFPSH